MSNPLLDTSALPRFGEIRPEHVAPAVDALLAEATAALERATGGGVPADYDALSAVLDVATERLGRAWGAVSHLNAVADTPELRAAYTEALPRVTEFYTNLGADERLYAKYKAVAGSPAAAALNASRRKALSNAMRDFVLSGAELQGAAKERFAAIQARQAELGQAFSEHVLDATDGWSCIASEAELAGVPEDVKAATRAAAQADGQDGHKLGLHMPVYLPVPAVRAGPLAARTRLPRPRDARLGGRPGRARQQRRDGRDPRVAAGRGRTAGLSQLRRGLSGRQDGRLAGAGAGFPARPGAARASARRA